MTGKFKLLLLLSSFIIVSIIFVSYPNAIKNYKYLNEYTTIELDNNLIHKTTTDSISLVNNKENPIKLFCIIFTVTSNFNKRTKIVNNTWAKHCTKYFFIAKLSNYSDEAIEFDKPFPIFQPSNFTIDVYDRLTDKLYLTLKDIYKLYPDYDWYLKSDDDTFVFVDNLKNFLKTKNRSEPLTFGYDFKVIVNKGYHSGGGGYVMSNQAFNRIGKKLNESYKFCPNSGVEDVDVAKCLRLLDVYPSKSIDELGRERFHPLDIPTHLKGGFPDWMYSYASNKLQKGIECCSTTSISFHYINPSDMQKINELWETGLSQNLTNEDTMNMLISRFNQ